MDRDAVRVLTYNVRRDVASDGEFDWAARRDAVASTLRFHRPDVIGLQEPLSHQYADVREALPEYEWVGQSRETADDEGEFCPVGYRRDRFERADAGTFWLSPTPDDPGSVGWDATYPRIATWVRLTDRRTGDSLLFCGTHLDHEGERARREGARVLRDRVAALRDADDGGRTPAVVAGDFNCVAGDDPHAVLAGTGDRESPLVDARDASAYPPHGPSTTRTDFESLRPGRQIDHVFVADCEVDGYGVAADVVGDGWFPSDHLPVVADLVL
ncbi:endonuclease/exonuclease/phosphatase family protein [Halosimplex salinum]|uniref:endonuclease/exonuclease/phosphatase family protein n=1 Tax=Halosimplex salinum TaxID=1710538 RepID=UPI000F46AA78|nr:endonuclease/exonuclease/phosphatase family protein [Halosimplex salinum]